MFQHIGDLVGNFTLLSIFVYFTLILFSVIKIKNPPKFVENPSKYFKATLIIGIIFIILSIALKFVAYRM
jgi:hypothetical protein